MREHFLLIYDLGKRLYSFLFFFIGESLFSQNIAISNINFDIEGGNFLKAKMVFRHGMEV